jgi:hypothetical protein
MIQKKTIISTFRLKVGGVGTQPGYAVWRHGFDHSKTQGDIITNAKHCTTEDLFTGSSQP